jgi:hypothetical protein
MSGNVAKSNVASRFMRFVCSTCFDHSNKWPEYFSSAPVLTTARGRGEGEKLRFRKKERHFLSPPHPHRREPLKVFKTTEGQSFA